MRDIRGDLQDRANMLEQQMNAAQLQFEQLREELKKDQASRLDDLKARLRAVNRLIEVAAWYHNVRTAVVLAVSAAEAVEASVAASRLSESSASGGVGA